MELNQINSKSPPKHDKLIDEDEESTNRKILISNNEDIINTVGLSNAITTTKYNLLTWLPLSIWEQFRRIANCYYVGISILMLIGDYATFLFQTPLNPYSTIGTFLLVLLVTSCKVGYEDYQRAVSDKEENKKIVKIIKFHNNEIIEKEIECQYIKAGDIIKLEGKTAVPADVVLLMTSLYGDGNQCYIETANIDGETNLKVREAPIALSPLCTEDKPNIKLFRGSIDFEAPNKDIHNFIGALDLEELPDPIPLTVENIILRGALFSNTDWAYVVAIYTGQETKIQMNNRHTDFKMSKIEGYLNKAVMIIFMSQCILVSISVISIYILGYQHVSKLPYINVNGKISNSILPLWLENW